MNRKEGHVIGAGMGSKQKGGTCCEHTEWNTVHSLAGISLSEKNMSCL